MIDYVLTLCLIYSNISTARQLSIGGNNESKTLLSGLRKKQTVSFSEPDESTINLSGKQSLDKDVNLPESPGNDELQHEEDFPEVKVDFQVRSLVYGTFLFSL